MFFSTEDDQMDKHNSLHNITHIDQKGKLRKHRYTKEDMTEYTQIFFSEILFVNHFTYKKEKEHTKCIWLMSSQQNIMKTWFS